MISEQPVARATGDEPIEDAIDAMLAADLGVMPVVSSRGQLEGMLVLDDLERVSGLIEGVRETRSRRTSDAGAGAANVVMACAFVSAALGLALFALWVVGPSYGLPRWVAWVDGLAAVLALIGAFPGSVRELISIPLWAVSGIGLCFAAGVGHAWNDGRWSTWLQLAFAVVFFLMVAVTGTAVPSHRSRVAAQPS
jgi:hypothetical protein